MADSVINCELKKDDIVFAIKTALSHEFVKKSSKSEYPYGDGHVAEKIVKILHEWLDEDKIDLKKKFYDL